MPSRNLTYAKQIDKFVIRIDHYLKRDGYIFYYIFVLLKCYVVCCFAWCTQGNLPKCTCYNIFLYCLLCFDAGKVQYEKGKPISRFLNVFLCLGTSNGLTLNKFRFRRNCMRACSQEKKNRLVLFLPFLSCLMWKSVMYRSYRVKILKKQTFLDNISRQLKNLDFMSSSILTKFVQRFVLFRKCQRIALLISSNFLLNSLVSSEKYNSMRKITRPRKMSIVNMPMINKENGMPNLVPYSHRLNSKPAVSQFRLRSLEKNRYNKTEDCLNYILDFVRNLTPNIFNSNTADIIIFSKKFSTTMFSQATAVCKFSSLRIQI